MPSLTPTQDAELRLPTRGHRQITGAAGDADLREHDRHRNQRDFFVEEGAGELI